MTGNNRGLLFIAFGEEYDKLAARTIAISRKFTSLPILVLSNIHSDKRYHRWSEVPDIEFKYIDLPLEMNRGIKTSMIHYSPFDSTIFLDCDLVIQNEGIEKVFDMLGENDIVMEHWGNWNVGEKFFQLYKNAVVKTGTKLPLEIYCSAFIAFHKNQKLIEFFDLWNKYWKISGCNRDMPALACAVKNSNLNTVKTVFKNDKIFAYKKLQSEAIIQHRCGPEFFRHFKIPRHKEWKPFDNKKFGFWKKVNIDDE